MMQMKWEPSVSVLAMRPVAAALRVLGYAVNPILKASGLTPEILKDIDGRIPHRTMMQFWNEALTVTADDYLGIHLAEAAPVDSLGIHAYATMASPTLREAYRRACRYQRLIHEVTDLVLDEGEEGGILHHALPGGLPVPRHPAEFLVTLWVRLGRMVLDVDWLPSMVCFAHEAPSNTSNHERFFCSAIQFSSGRTALHIPRHLLDATNSSANIGLVHMLDEYAERLMDQMPSAATLSERVRYLLLQDMNGGLPTAEGIARELHMSVRTLHRSLRQEGATFRELLSRLRHEQAVRFLANPSISISEVAFLLGFSEVSSFYRAFKNWTGTTPADYRATLHPPSTTSSR